MAKPIEPTPILSGKDKERFLNDLNSLRYSKEKETFLKECIEIYSRTKKQI